MGWPRLLTTIAVVEAAGLAWVGLAVHDREAVLLAVATAGAIALLRIRRGLLGDVALALVCTDVVGWLAPAAVDNIRHHDSFNAVVVPVLLGCVALMGLAAVAGHLLWRRHPSRGVRTRGPAVVLGVGPALVATILLIAAITGLGHDRSLPPGAVVLSARNANFSTSTLHASAGTVTVALTNHDLFWHTFTIDRLDVNLNVPVGGHRHVTFQATPGTYVFYCAIPGHRSIGMEGTIVIAG